MNKEFPFKNLPNADKIKIISDSWKKLTKDQKKEWMEEVDQDEEMVDEKAPKVKEVSKPAPKAREVAKTTPIKR